MGLMAGELHSKLEEVLERQDLRNYTTFHIGGCCDLMCKPENINELKKIVKIIYNLKTPSYIIGNGSNILVSDNGFPGVIINMRNLNNITVDGTIIQCQAGALLPAIIQKAVHKGLSGVEFASGIPGTLGGALYMNAGTGKNAIGDIVKGATALNRKGDVLKLSKEDLSFGYRNSIFRDCNLIICHADLQLKPGNHTNIIKSINRFQRKRKDTQPINARCAGSVFKNPHDSSAGELIDKAGLKGKKIGDAQISLKHANFIINLGNATSTDVMALMEITRKTVKEKYGIELELEIELLGFDNALDGGEGLGKINN